MMEPTMTLSQAIDFLREKKEKAANAHDRSIYQQLINDLKFTRVHHKRNQEYDGFGGLLFDVRFNKGLTRKEFADRLGIKENTVAGYEANTFIPSDRMIERIGKTFTVDTEYLLTEKMRFQKLEGIA